MDSSTETSTKQPAVGDAVQAKCGKCKGVTKHTVLAMVDEAPSKVRCTICESDHKFRAPAKPRAPKAPRAPKKSPDVLEWAKLSPKWDEAKAHPYKMSTSFKKNDLIVT